mmetsp:Transcript_8919/g.16214  ORF Transcript_8919/g.16214 Transcript_8919/m.16214 type:complete len:156 (-) Transcript_8919:74-541(-)
MGRPTSGNTADFKPPALPHGTPTGEELLRLLRNRREKGERREQEYRRSFEQLERKLNLAEQHTCREPPHVVVPPRVLQHRKSLGRRSFSGESSPFSSDSDEFSGKWSARSSDSDEFSTRWSARSSASGMSIASGRAYGRTSDACQVRHARPWRRP